MMNRVMINIFISVLYSILILFIYYINKKRNLIFNNNININLYINKNNNNIY